MVFKGRRVLVVEDDMMIAMMMDDMLSELGCRVIGPLHGLTSALTLVKDGDGAIEVAFLDVNLAGEAVFPLADILRAKGVPLVFCTGYGDSETTLREAYPDSAILVKPYRPNQITAALRQALAPESFESEL